MWGLYQQIKELEAENKALKKKLKESEEEVRRLEERLEDLYYDMKEER